MDELKALMMVQERKKEQVVRSWSKEQENILKIWGEKAAGYRWLHNHASRHYKKINDRLSFANIIFSTLAGMTSFGIASENDDKYNIYAYVIAGVNVFSAFLASLQKYYKCAEKSENHCNIAIQFAAFYRNISVELMQSPAARTSARELGKNCRAEYDRMMQIAPHIPNVSINAFKKKFPNAINRPEVANGLTEIAVYDRSEEMIRKHKKKHTFGLWRAFSKPDLEEDFKDARSSI